MPPRRAARVLRCPQGASCLALSEATGIRKRRRPRHQPARFDESKNSGGGGAVLQLVHPERNLAQSLERPMRSGGKLLLAVRSIWRVQDVSQSKEAGARRGLIS